MPIPVSDELQGAPSTEGDGEDLLRLAQQAGIVETPAASGGPVTSPEDIDSQHQDPAGFATGLTPPATAPAPQSQGSSRSASYSGVNLGKLQTVSPMVDKALAPQFKGAADEATAAAAPVLDSLNQTKVQGTKAIGDVTDATHAEIMAQGREDRMMADIYTAAGTEEAKINEQARAESNTAKADYMAALTDFRGQRVDPQALWKQMGTGNQLGMLVSAFVQDFLGVKGIHISAMDTFNKAVDRNIDAQIQNIKNKGEVAQGFKTLWEMQRAQSASDVEARARVRGFMIDGAKQAVVAHMSQYKAAMSDAQGQAALAKLDEEFSKNLIDVYKHIDTSTIQRREQAIQVFGEKLRAATEQAKIAAEDRRAERATKATAVNPLDDLIISPETNRPIGIFRSDAQKEEKAALRKLLYSTADVNKDFKDLRDLVRETKSNPDLISGTRLAGTGQQRFDLISKSIGNKIARATDGRVSATEVQQFMAGVRPDTWLNQAETEKVIAQAQNTFLGSSREAYRQLARDLPADDERRNITFATQDPFNVSATETNADINPVPPTHREVMVKNYAEEAATAYTPDSKHPLDTPPTNVSDAVQEFSIQHPDAYDRTRAPIRRKDGSIKTATVSGKEFNGQYPVFPWEEGLVNLKEEAAKGGKEGEAARAELMAEAKEYLTQRKMGGGETSASPSSIFATMMLHQLHTDNPLLFSNDPEEENK